MPFEILLLKDASTDRCLMASRPISQRIGFSDAVGVPGSSAIVNLPLPQTSSGLDTIQDFVVDDFENPITPSEDRVSHEVDDQNINITIEEEVTLTRVGFYRAQLIFLSSSGMVQESKTICRCAISILRSQERR